jgi:hypothetical protein
MRACSQLLSEPFNYLLTCHRDKLHNDECQLTQLHACVTALQGGWRTISHLRSLKCCKSKEGTSAYEMIIC